MTLRLPDDATLRRRRDAAIDGGVLAALDIGAAVLRCVVVRIASHGGDDSGEADLFSGVRVAGFAEVPVPADPVLLPDAMARSLDSACRDAGVSRVPVVVTVSGARPSVVTGEASVDLTDGEVFEADIERVLSRIRVPVAQTRTRLSAFVLAYELDDVPVADPLEHEGRVLRARVGATLTDRAPVLGLATTIEHLGIGLAGFVASPVAAGRACLLDSELQMGAAVVDIGARHTGVAVFTNGMPVHLDDIAMGAGRITDDLAAAFALDRATAERHKRSLGEAPDPEGPPRSAMLGVVRPRLEEILSLVRGSLERASFYDAGPRPIVMTGGGASGHGVLEAAQRLLGPRARLGPPVRVTMTGRPAAMADAGVLGAVVEAIRAAHDPFEPITSAATAPMTRLRGAVDWLRQNW